MPTDPTVSPADVPREGLDGAVSAPEAAGEGLGVPVRSDAADGRVAARGPVADLLRVALLATADTHDMPVTLRDVDVLARAATAVWIALPVPEPGDGPLTTRQLQVLRLVASGLPDEEIAALLDMTRSTVRNNLKRLADRLGAASRAHAVAISVAAGWITASDIRPGDDAVVQRRPRSIPRQGATS